MRLGTGLRVAVAGAAALAGCVIAGVSPASAGGQGSFTTTTHFTSPDQWGTPLGTPTSATNCTGPIGNAFINDFVNFNLTGNGISHLTVNKAGDGWFTSTFEGTGT